MNIGEFWDNMVETPDGCWEWTRYRNKDGYGQARLNGSEELAHRHAWTLTFGPIPDGLCVLHHCDNPPCCNPAHLYCGTQKNNAEDRVNRGRNVNPPTQRGEDNQGAKLTPEQVLSIRKDPRKTGIISAEYGITTGSVRKIKRKATWKHLTDELMTENG